MLVNKYFSVSKEVCVQNKVDHSMDRVHVKWKTYVKIL